MSNIKAGDIVTDQVEDSVFNGKQGLVVAVQLCFWWGAEITVAFEKRYWKYHRYEEDLAHLGSWIQVEEPYTQSDLTLNDDWLPEVYDERLDGQAKSLFGNKYHSVYKPKFELDSNRSCMVENCSGKQAKTAWFNVWGSVCPAHVCEACVQTYHKSFLDSFPWRKQKTG